MGYIGMVCILEVDQVNLYRLLRFEALLVNLVLRHSEETKSFFLVWTGFHLQMRISKSSTKRRRWSFISFSLSLFIQFIRFVLGQRA